MHKIPVLSHLSINTLYLMFNNLPLETLEHIAQNLSNKDLVSFSQTSSYYLTLFQPLITIRKSTQELLGYVVNGKIEQVEVLLKKNIRLVYLRGKIRDCSGRLFENISAFEYALWALDKHIWTKIIQCLPDSEKGQEVLIQLIRQYNIIDTDGITYKLNEETFTEQHFDFENTIIKELEGVQSKLNAGIRCWEASGEQWRTGVGRAQRLFPMHVVFEYCKASPSYLTNECDLQTQFATQFLNTATNKLESWFSEESHLSNFAISKARPGMIARSYELVPSKVVELDLKDMRALCEARINDFHNLKSQLEKSKLPGLSSYNVC